MSPQDQRDSGFGGAARWPSGNDADQPPGFEELLISTSVELWLATRNAPHQGRAFLDAGVAALRREQEQTKLKQAVLRHIIGMGMRRLRDEEGVTVKRIVSRTTWDGDPRRPVSRAWVDKHMLTPDQYGKIVDIFSRAEHDYSRIAVDPEAFPAARTGAQRNSGYLRQLMRWIGARATGAAVLALALFLITHTATDIETVTGLSATSLLMAAASSRLTGAPNIPGFDPAATVQLGHSVSGLSASGLTTWTGSVPATTGVASASASATAGPATTTVTKFTVGVVAGVEALVGVSAPVATTLVAVPAIVAAAPVVEQAATGFHDLLGPSGDPVRPGAAEPSPTPNRDTPTVPNGSPVEVPAVKATSGPASPSDGLVSAAPTTAAPAVPTAAPALTAATSPSPTPTPESKLPSAEATTPAAPSPLADASMPSASAPTQHPESSPSTPETEPSAAPTVAPTPEPIPAPSATAEPAPTDQPAPTPAPTQEPVPTPTGTDQPAPTQEPAPTSSSEAEPSASAPPDGTPPADTVEEVASRPVACKEKNRSWRRGSAPHQRPVMV
ncbi:hypothetical protein [Planomonospora sp. ID82291]|uniref:hypothetical protein n=1 Tax=Planomonospora sp. ID82291 TaxID=2738136 RepID=UPI0018C3D5FC|nr:hypothetical protein [Planomonospora sp. ID82291]MBG0818325.1 hypothetical protein [Planomonospora sp. ID82291]